MTEQQPNQSGMDNSWAAWKDRLAIMGVVLALLVLFLFMFTDASFNFQCGVIDFITFKCNRLDRKFVPWDKFDKQHGKSSSSLRVKRFGVNRPNQFRMATIV